MRTNHQANRTAAFGFGGRFSIGLSIALAFVLVAFEWKTTASRPEPAVCDLLPEPVTPDQPTILWTKQKQDNVEAAEPKPRMKRNGPAVVGELPEVIEGKEVPDGAGPTDPGPVIDDPGPAPVPYREEKVETPPTPWDRVEQRPYFRKCLDARRADLDECTERTIDLHLKRYFVVPEAMRREERTTVSIVIDAEGRIANVLCVPKPSPAVAAEIERVIRGLPPMNPATQNGLPVPVVFQLPFRVSRL
ncbi:MAG: hypothetical protein IPK70_02150 [Flavobacteriales bacterium]|nr:hypothetical protein [Flavobacteriales bacterium]